MTVPGGADLGELGRDAPGVGRSGERHRPRFAPTVHHRPNDRTVEQQYDDFGCRRGSGGHHRGLARGRVGEAAAAFARDAVAAVAPTAPARARSLLWACSRLAEWGTGVGLDARPEVLLHP
jgi:hypothetical protein